MSEDIRAKRRKIIGEMFYQPPEMMHVAMERALDSLEMLDESDDELSSHVENIHAAFTRAQQKEVTYDALKDARHFEDAVNADVIRQAAYADFFRAFVKMIDNDPTVWRKLK